MARVSGGLFAMSASGTVGKVLTYAKWRGQDYVRQWTMPKIGQGEDQITMRDLISQITKAWKAGGTVGGVTLNSSYKLAYNDAAAGQMYSGFNLFVKDSVAKNGNVNFAGTLELPTVPGDIS
jgi:hypothetical protein